MQMHEALIISAALLLIAAAAVSGELFPRFLSAGNANLRAKLGFR
jgi:hypothetical protein